MVSINAEHKLSVSINDAAGRGVMSAQIEPYNGTTPNALITWNCQQYDNVVTKTYDDASRLASESLTIASQTYAVESQYDARGQLWKLTYPDGKIVERTHHADGQLHQVKYDGAMDLSQ